MTAAPRRRRWPRRVAWGSLGLVVLAGIAGYLLRARIEERIRVELEARVSRAIHGQLRIGELDLSPLRLEVGVRDVHLEIPEEGTGGLSFDLRAGEARLAWTGLVKLAARRIHLASLRLEGPSIDLHRDFFDARRGRGRGREAPFAVRIDRARVEDGRVRYRDHELPIDAEATDVDLRGTWASYRRALVGEVSLGGTITREPFREPLPIRVRSAFRLRETGVELFETHAEAPGVVADVERQVISWDEGTFLTARARVDADLAELRRRMTDDVPKLAGRVRGTVSWSQEAGPFQIRGRLHGDDVALDDIRVANLDAYATLERGVLHLAEIDGEGYGGKISGDVSVDFERPTKVTLDLRGLGLDAQRLLELARLELPLAAVVDADVRFRGSPAVPSSWNGSGSARLEPSQGGEGTVPVGGGGDFSIVDGRLSLEDAAVISDASDLTLDLAYAFPCSTGVVWLRGRTHRAAGTQEETLRVMRRLGVTPPDLMARPLTGTGTVDTRIRLGGATSLAVDLALEEGAWDGKPFDELGLALDLEGDTLTIPRLHVGAVDWSAEASLVLDTTTGRPTHVDLDARAVPLDVALEVVEVALPVRAAVSGRLSLEGGENGLRGAGWIHLSDVSWQGERLDAVDAKLEVDHDRAVLNAASARGPALEADGTVRVDLATGSTEIDLERAEIRVGQLERVRASGTEVDLTVGARGRVAWHDGALGGELEVSAPAGNLFGRRSMPLAGTVSIGADAARFELGSPEGGTWKAEGSVALDEALTVEGSVLLDRFRYDLVQDPTLPPAWLRTSGRLAVSGPLSDPEALRLQGSLESSELRLGTRLLRAPDAIPLGLSGGTLEVGPLRLKGRRSDLVAQVRVPIEEGRLSGSVEGDVDLGVVAALFPDIAASGSVAVAVTLGGTLARPDLGGTLHLDGGRVRLLGFAQTLDGIRLDATLAGREAHVETFRGVIGGGEVSGSGGIQFEGLEVGTYYLDLDATNVALEYPEGFRGVYDGRFDLRGDSKAALLGGRIDVLRGVYDRDFELGSLLGRGTREYAPESGLDIPARVSLDLDVRATDNVWVRNNLAKVESSVDLHVGGDLRQPEVTGRIRALEGGTVTFRDVEYQLESATLDFVNLERIDPYVNLRAKTEIKGYEIFLHVEGTLERISYDLTSNPSLSSEDIIALLTTGSTLEELTARGQSPGSAFTGDMAANYFANALTGRFEKQLQQALGLERIEISPLLAPGTADPTARITIGKEVADNLLLIYSTELGTTERQLYQVQWQVSRKLRLTGERDTTGGIGGEVSYTGRFWLRRPEATPAAAPSTGTTVGAGAPPRAGPPPPVASVRFEGVADRESKDLEGRVPLRKGKPYRRAELFDGAEKIRAYYVKRGHVQVEVDAEATPPVSGSDAPGVEVTYRVRPGPEYDLRFAGVSRRDERRLRARLREMWTSSVVVGTRFRDAAEAIREYYRSRGYYTVDVVVRRSWTGEEDERSPGPRVVTFDVDPGKPVRVSSLVIEGNRVISTERIQKQMLTRESSVFSRKLLVPKTLAEDVAAIRSLYRDQGFLEVEVEDPVVRLSTDGGSAEVTVRIGEGRRFTIAELATPEGIAFPHDEIVRWSGLRVGEVFSRPRLLEAESAVRAALDERGYPDARVDGTFELGDGTASVHLDVDPGRPKVVARVDVEGNALTGRRIVTRELLLAPGDALSRDKLLRSQHRLYKLGIFRNVRLDYVPLEGGNPSQYVLRVHVEEAPPYSLAIGAGYDSEAGYRGTFSITNENLGGRDRTLGLSVRASGIEERVQILAQEPRLFARRLPTLFTLYQERLDENGFTVKRRSAAFRVENKFAGKWTGFWRYNYQRVDLLNVDAEDAPQLAEQKLENLRLGDVGYTLVRDSRDDPFMTHEGAYGALEVRFFLPVLLSDSTFVKAFLQGTYTHTFRNDTAYAWGVRVGAARPFGGTTEIPLSERYFAGGDSSLRGFPRDEVGPVAVGADGSVVYVGGDALFLLNQEFRYPIWGPVRGVVFYDAGNVFARVEDFDPLDLRHVLGTGVRLDTPIGPIRLEYGRKLHRKSGESAGEWFIAIGAAF